MFKITSMVSLITGSSYGSSHLVISRPINVGTLFMIHTCITYLHLLANSQLIRRTMKTLVPPRTYLSPPDLYPTDCQQTFLSTADPSVQASRIDSHPNRSVRPMKDLTIVSCIFLISLATSSTVSTSLLTFRCKFYTQSSFSLSLLKK